MSVHWSVNSWKEFTPQLELMLFTDIYTKLKDYLLALASIGAYSANCELTYSTPLPAWAALSRKSLRSSSSFPVT